MNQQKISQLEIQQEKFSGPLDLLLSLIEERKLEITEVNLAQVTDAFLSYIGDLKQASPDVLADFLVVAAKLILIKSKSLLPTLELSAEEETEIKDLTERLEIYRLFKNASQFIKEKFTQNQMFAREFLINQSPIFYPPEHCTPEMLYNSFVKIWQEFSSLGEIAIEKIKKVIKIEEKIRNLVKILTERTSSEFNQLVSKREKIEVIVTFLAILQMFKEQLIMVDQQENFGEIIITIKQSHYHE
ncbi:MAG TPA: segregation/condensation protein A [Candidatus Paceibacterota bacterium]|nr:segregation/condensation protein A [Candidatus Paceibacterota bacterium]HOL53800.1 segregation/condensation protein A [Candidatus Paceibacterota bacterium]HON21564.1 segregation/condensation protein A [Candidatus Paceibacterota bacterium]HPP16941.1 segregation/condensation protein A [Candidatus Paceibacterota bacterium]HRU33437.1 segregation/condensation protein A [Candidatus Paceibacterota bacterium]